MNEKLHPRTVALSLASLMGFLYLLCAFFFAIAPLPTLQFFRILFHGIDIAKISTSAISFGAAFAGFLETVVVSFLIGWLFAAIYNAFSARLKNR